jgi:hypothetical protein
MATSEKTTKPSKLPSRAILRKMIASGKSIPSKASKR